MKPTSHARTVLPLSALALIATGGLLLAGPLDPPVGPITSTYKTLTEIEPRTIINATNTPGDAICLFKITQPGSYYLTGNITGVSGKNGIIIQANNVTVDLSGFEVVGVAGSGHGITTNATPFSRISVLNGTVRGWGGTGVMLFGGPTNVTCSRITASDNTLSGIIVGQSSVVTECTAQGNLEWGIVSEGGSTVSNCTARENTLIGIYCLSSTVTGCSARSNLGTGFRVDASTVSGCQSGSNAGYGFDIVKGSLSDCVSNSNTGASGTGFLARDGTSLDNCTASSNSGAGFSSSNAATLSGCTAYLNGNNGFIATECTLTGCNADGNTQAGFNISKCTLTSCAANGNTAQGFGGVGQPSSLSLCYAQNNTSTGIHLGVRGTVVDCTSSQNGGSGITVADFSTVSRSTCDQNTVDGITVSRSCHVRENSCSFNGTVSGTGSGINCTSILNRVEDNLCNENARGISATGARNVFVRNTCGSNVLNWNVNAGNHLLVLNAPAAAAVSGNTGGTSLSTDPYANFSH